MVCRPKPSAKGPFFNNGVIKCWGPGVRGVRRFGARTITDFLFFEYFLSPESHSTHVGRTKRLWVSRGPPRCYLRSTKWSRRGLLILLVQPSSYLLNLFPVLAFSGLKSFKERRICDSRDLYTSSDIPSPIVHNGPWAQRIFQIFCQHIQGVSRLLSSFCQIYDSLARES